MLKYITVLFYILGIFNIAFALEISSENEYYYIEPKTPQDVYALILANAPSDEQHFKVTGQYISKVNITGNYRGTILEEGDSRCVFLDAKVHLHGRFISPQLKANHAFKKEVLVTFDEELTKIINHEKQHEQIYIDELFLLKNRLEQMANEERASCQLLERQVKIAYNQTMANIEQKNRALDCDEYGYKIGVASCQSAYVYEIKPDKSQAYPNAYKTINLSNHARPSK